MSRLGPLDVKRRSDSLQGHDVAAVAVEVAQYGVGEFAVHLDVLLAADRVPQQPVGRPSVAEQADEERSFINKVHWRLDILIGFPIIQFTPNSK
jgi:hypothetical protein